MKLNIISQDEMNNGVVYNAKGDLIAGNYAQAGLDSAGNDAEIVWEFDRASGDLLYIRTLNGITQPAAVQAQWAETGPTPPPWNGSYEIRWDAPVEESPSGPGGINPGTAQATYLDFNTDFTFSLSTIGPEREYSWNVYLRKTGQPATEVIINIRSTVSVGL